MNTWRVELSRDGNGNLISTTPEACPDWVRDLIGDLTYRFTDNADALHLSCQVSGQDPASPPEEPTDATAGTTGPVTSTGPGTAPPDTTPATAVDGLLDAAPAADAGTDPPA